MEDGGELKDLGNQFIFLLLMVAFSYTSSELAAKDFIDWLSTSTNMLEYFRRLEEACNTIARMYCTVYIDTDSHIDGMKHFGEHSAPSIYRPIESNHMCTTCGA